MSHEYLKLSAPQSEFTILSLSHKLAPFSSLLPPHLNAQCQLLAQAKKEKTPVVIFAYYFHHPPYPILFLVVKLNFQTINDHFLLKTIFFLCSLTCLEDLQSLQRFASKGQICNMSSWFLYSNLNSKLAYML